MSSKKGRRAESSLENSGLLDAYTGTKDGSGVGQSSAGHKPITKKNKNQKKRELARQQQERRESEKAAEASENGDVIAESWEDIQDNVDDVPPPPEFVIDKEAVNERKQQEAKAATKHQPRPTKQPKSPANDTSVQKALADLNSTIGQVSGILSSMSISSSNEESKKPAKPASNKPASAKPASAKPPPKAEEIKPDNPSAGPEKTKEQIKAEREAKKKEKQAKRAAAKGSDQKPEQPKPEPEVKDAETPQKSKAELKAERRAKQEAQRAAKAAAQAEGATGGAKPAQKADKPDQSKPSKPEKVPEKKHRVPDDIQADRVSVEKKMQKKLASQNLPQRPKAQRKVMLFSHLHQYERELSISKDLPVVGSHIHPAIVQLGLKYAEGLIQGSNARCLAFMNAMKQVIIDHVTPEDRQFSRDLDAKLKTHVTFLKGCRNHSVSMGNAIRVLKNKINTMSASTDEKEAKQILINAIETFTEHVELAAIQISMTACDMIRDGDVILTYGCSSLLRSVFVRALKRGLKFRVIVADGRPKFEGREMARHLVNDGVHCTYVVVHSLSCVIGEVTKVVLGAHAVLANGNVMSRVGTSQVALIAKAHNVPVLVCCETYKFTERVQTDSFVFNELGDPDDLIATGGSNALEDWRDLSSLHLLYLNYDVTPASLVSAIISEISVIPCTSVPVVLRLKASE